MKNKKYLIIFLLILATAAFLRLYNLQSVPPGVNRDEASIGYTAYSLLNTGKDEYGLSYPISFQSFGDWKLPFYIYTTTLFVKFLGLSELAVRLPSAIFGIATVGLTYFLVRKLFKSELLSFLSMFLIAVSPWHLHLSRVESESNTAVFFIASGLFLFLKSLRGNKFWLLLSFFLFSLTYYTYAGNHIFTTLFVAGLIFIYRSEIKKTKFFYASIIIFLLLSGFIFSHTLFGADKTKVSGISIFGDPSIVHAKIEIPRNEHVNPGSLLSKIAHNKAVFGLWRFGENYLNSFSPGFLFIKGGENKAHNIEGFGNMYLIEAPFLFFGILCLFALQKGRERNLVLFWLLISPLAASITKDAPHSNRMFAVFPILSLITAFGFFWFFNNFLKQRFTRFLSIIIVALLFLINIIVYLDRYYIHFPKNEAASWGLGYKTLSEMLGRPGFSSEKIVINRPEYSPYIYLLFYSKYDPILYQKSAVRYPPTEDRFIHVKSFDRFEFRDINWEKDLFRPNTLVISYSQDFPESLKNSFPTTKVAFNGKVMFVIPGYFK